MYLFILAHDRKMTSHATSPQLFLRNEVFREVDSGLTAPWSGSLVSYLNPQYERMRVK